MTRINLRARTTKARAQKQRRCARCGHLEAAHKYVNPDHYACAECGCENFQEPPKRQRRSVVKYAKQAERDVADLIGGERIPSGVHTGSGDIDVTSNRLAVQVKHRALPAWLREGMEQIEAAHTGDRLGIVAVVEKPGSGSGKRRILAVLDLAELVELLL